MTELKPCPKCGYFPQLSYACGEFFVVGGSDCPMCGGFNAVERELSPGVFEALIRAVKDGDADA